MKIIDVECPECQGQGDFCENCFGLGTVERFTDVDA
jgi:DnaJ-class molecular chaperone